MVQSGQNRRHFKSGNRRMAGNLAQYFAQHLGVPGKVLYRQFGDGWADVTVAEVAALVGRWQRALKALELDAGARIALCIRNSVDWIALDLAALGSGMVVVPLYVDDNPDNIAWCAGNAEVQLLVVESTHLAQALEDTRAPLPPIRVLHPDADDRRASVAALLAASACTLQGSARCRVRGGTREVMPYRVDPGLKPALEFK